MKNLIIRATTKTDLENLIHLWNDGQAMKWVGYPNGLSYDHKKIQQWFEAYKKNPNTHHFMIYTQNKAFCGELFYRKYIGQNLASLDIILLPEAQGQGIATQAFKTLIQILFEGETSVEEVFTEPNDFNQKAQRLYTRCGLTPRPRPHFLHPADSYWSLKRKDWETKLKEYDE
jgi:RimJ/RimL family protein N-acetyltransferase